jgi:RHS repeat-associated protein
VDGPIVRVTHADGATVPATVNLMLGYAGFAGAYGGDFGARLRLVRLPECALTTPDRPGCRSATPLPSTNDGADDTVSADVSVAGRAGGVYALTAGESSSQGDYSATSLAPSSTWSVAPSSGAFNWSYPLRLPPTPGGRAPEVALSYSSQSVDGRTSATNNQGSWIGEGFGYEPGYIERRYKGCPDDGHDSVADQCWGHENATIVLNGASGELIKDGSGRWRMTNDQDWRIEPRTETVNGDDNGEHWRITTPDGTEYYFGLNRLFGWTTGKEETNSTWSVPVYGDDAQEPCHDATFANAWCHQAWRWNLDYVRDPHGNVISYFYGRESNRYARGAKTDIDGTEYHRGGWLRRIDYGQRHNAVYTTNAPARVQFATAERCLPGGGVSCAESELTEANAPSWPDVPFDRICAAGTRCTLDQASPSYFTRKRLTKVTTEIRSGTGWTPVDSWSLDHWFTDNADGSKTLWLNKIDHVGHVGGTAAVPSVQLVGEQLPNRIVNPLQGDNLIRFRVNTVYTDTGGQIHVNYAPADCAVGSLPRPGESTRRCFPVRWNPSNGAPLTDWFHKYVVEEVIETDRTGGAPDMVTRYRYIGGAAWRKAEPDGFTKAEDLTWSQWRGYGKVEVTRGDGQFMPAKAEHTFLRGMHGDPLPGGGTRDVTVADSTGATHRDTDELAGHELETVVYDGANVVSKTITVPWLHQTGSRTHTWGTVRATYLRPGTARSLTALAAGGWRETKVVNTYDTGHGRLTQTDDLGDVDTPADDRCARTGYADNEDRWMFSYVSRVETVSVKCATAPNRANQVISDVRTWFDGKAFGVAPEFGNPTRTEKLATHDGNTATYVTEAVSTFDAWGRPLTVADAAGSTTTTVYTQTDGLTTKKEETGPLGSAWKTTTEYAPAWGAPRSQVDMNGKRADLEYDPLGRLVRVWLPDRSKAQNVSPNLKYTYRLVTDQPVSVKTEKIRNDGGYSVDYTLYDGHLRPRQLQGEGPDGSRLVADTFYTGTGQTARTHDTYHAAGPPSDQILTVDNGDVDGQTVVRYDGADRVVAETFQVAGAEKWTTTTSYGGDRVHVDPPAGGIPTTTITDARGNTTALRQYRGTSPAGAYDQTTYTYTPAGQMATLTNPAGTRWEWRYDQRGRKVEARDPDAGTTTYTYDDLDRQTTATDAREVLLTYVYDKLGRKTDTYHGTAATGTRIARWTYDQVAKGQLYSSVRIAAGKSYGVVYPLRDALYRPLKVQYVIPAETGAAELAGTYEFTTSYNHDGTVQGNGMAPMGGLPAEALVFGYDALQRPTSMTGATPYVTGASYAQTGELLQAELNTGGRKAWLTWYHEEGTKRLTRSKLDRQGSPTTDIDANYRYDEAGNVLSIADTPAGGPRDIQCFTYDYLRRLTEAWSTSNTASTPCAGGPAATGVAGPAPYHHSYTYDPVSGGRDTETIHGLGGAADTTRDYSYPASGQPRPHSLSQVVERTPAGDRLHAYRYDNAGNTIERDRAGDKQTLAWDAEGHLASVTEGGQPTGFLYDADGNRLLRKEPGATTLYLAGTELRLNHATRAVEGTRFYSFAGRTMAVRTVAGVKFLAGDHQGTQSATVDAATGAITRRRTTPFGAVRGADPAAWPGDKGFVGGTRDVTTGLTHLGAREYDPDIGRFISVDPVFVQDDPAQFNAYQYGRNNPVTFSDPSGLRPLDESELNRYNSPSSTYTPDQAPVEDPQLRAAREAAERAKQKIIESAKALLKIAMDELGVTAALDCLTNGDMGACGEVIIDIATSFVGGLAAKLARKYGLPWNWGKAVELGKKVWNKLGELVGGIRDWFKNTKLVQQLMKRGDCKGLKGNSFVPGTPVLLAGGKTKPIEELDVGDQVVATDPETGETRPEPVVATIIGHGTKELVQITVDVDGAAGDATGVIVATANHPFWVAKPGEWLDAEDLRAGHWLRTSAGTWVQVTAVERGTRTATVHNLTVADIHTYYVLAGHAPVLVHNDDNTTRLGVTRTNPQDWRDQMRIWDDDPIYKDILSKGNRWRIEHDLVPRVDKQWVQFFPGDEKLIGEKITMHHIGGYKLTAPLPTSRHLDAHMPGGFRYNPGGPGCTG